MAEPQKTRTFPKAEQSYRGEEPLLIGAIGPPGGGKTVSMLRLATGVKSVRGGPIILIDTEAGRSKKYSPKKGEKPDPEALKFDFLRVDMSPPFRSDDFLAVIKAQLPLNPSAIITDTMSDEHEGEGGYLEWHEAEIPRMGGNEWAAWGKPAMARQRLKTGMLQIKVPLLFTFRSKQKTKQEGQGKGAKIINLGWMPIAPFELVHALDLTCILPPKADGVPTWTTDKLGEDFIIKLPYFLQPLIREGQLSEETGAALARWALGLEPEDLDAREAVLTELQAAIAAASPGETQAARNGRQRALYEALGVKKWAEAKALPLERLEAGLARLRPVPRPVSDGPPELLGAERAEALRAQAASAGIGPGDWDILVRQVGQPFGTANLAGMPAEVEAEVLERINLRGRS